MVLVFLLNGKVEGGYKRILNLDGERIRIERREDELMAGEEKRLIEELKAFRIVSIALSYFYGSNFNFQL